MKIVKVFNNNAVASVTADGRDVILTGAGLGFQKRAGDVIDEAKIEKRYFYQGEERDVLWELFDRTPVEYFTISQEIMDEAERRLHITLKDRVLAALTDHIAFAVERAESGETLPNLIFSEVRVLYRNEYEVGLWGLDLIEREIGVRLSEDEAGFIALHILNGSSEHGANDTLEMLQLISGCVQIIQDELGVCLDRDSLDYFRLTTHLKFLAQRIFAYSDEVGPMGDRQMFDLMCRQHPQVYQCALVIKSFISQEYSYDLPDGEVFYLMIHLCKVVL